ncbi:MAG: hypothetical protein ABR525_08595 [Candidatus Limnocylindria bacterium]
MKDKAPRNKTGETPTHTPEQTKKRLTEKKQGQQGKANRGRTDSKGSGSG